jgi:HEAT repeat protein
VRVLLTKDGGRITAVKSYVAGQWRPNASGTDLGTVSAPAAAEYLLALAERGGAGAKEAVFPATIADSFTAWPGLLRIAKSEQASRDTRKSAVFWLGQAVGDRITPALDSVATDRGGDREVRDAAVFALSQRPRDEGVPALMRLARNDRDPEIRKKAIFWLGQSDDPRALSFFEEVLTGR